MKRKLFTLLFALVALASFQVNASGPWWIKADTTGLSGNLSYGGNKVSPLQNWFVWAANDAAKINAENSTLFTDGLDSRFEVTQVGSNDRLINIKSLKSGSQKISLTYGANAWTQFEVVQFDYTTITTTPPYMGGARTTQALTSSGLEGYLMPAQGGLATLQDTTSSMLMVVSDKNGAFSIKRVDEVFTFVDSPDSITVPRVVPINWDASEFQGVSFGATDTLSYVSTYTNLVPYQSVEWGRIGLYKWAGIKQTGNQHPINMKIAGGKPIVYMTIGPGSPGWAAFTTKPELIYENPQWLTAYVGVDPAASGFSSEVTLAANWTNGLPYDFVTGSQSVNASSGGAYVIFRVDGTAKIKNGQVVSNPFVTVNGVDYPTIPGGPSVYDKVLASGGYTTNATLNKWRPVYIKLEKPAGRWATPDDFPCTYTTFPGLYVINSKLTAPYFTTDTIRTFVVKQVDWVAKTSGKQSDQNIFGNSGDGNHYVPKFDEVAVGGAIGGRDVGLQKVITLPAPAASGADSIIPLFTLSSPEVDCGVVSVSRQNDLDIQSQGIGVYANKLEIRDYGYYYDYKKNANGTYTYEKHQASSVHDWDWSHSGVDASGLDEDRVATSLQKFAFWIDIDGNYTMYPAASYSWEYGKTKEEEQSIVKPNSVLLYNNTEIALTTGGVEGLDKSWGVEIGTWNGRTTANPGVNSAIISTIPNVVITGNSDYTEITYNPTCNTEGIENLKGRFYFLDVLNPGVNPGTTGYFYNATRPNAIQDSTRTQYVLSTEVVSGVKQLIIIPKEKVRAYADGNGNKWYDALEAYKKIEKGELLPTYWDNNPYDSVNMAAHWEIINKGTAEAPLYLFVNMLGDTLQYNLGSSAIRGKYQPENGKIADDGKFSPEGGTDITWFNSPSTAADANTKRLWTASAIPGKEEGSFVLSLDKHILTGSGSWVASVIRAKTDSVYYKRVVSLEQPAAVLPWTVVNQEDCAGGLILKKSPIYYVPNYSASYGEERGDTLPNTIDRWKTINTNDTSFVDGRVRQDSLTAYLLLHGSYGIKEASRVDNGLMLGSITTEFGAKAAALTAAAANVSDIEFIPLAGSGRNEAIESLKGTANADSIKLDKLYGETYKWFLVKRGSQYLVFDTINPQTDEDHYKVGLTWQTLSTMANATPVRLYQPLVGDKLQGNFIFQFYVPCYTYGTTAAQTYRNIWPTGDGGDIRGKRLFGELSKQSNYIHGVRTLKDATRFTYTYVSPGAPDDCNCPEQFIAPDWMASQKLLSLPLEDQVWLAASTGFGFSTGRGNDATVNNTGITTLKHTYVDSIRPIGSGATLKGRYSYKVGTATTNEDIFKGEVAVPLYYVQNEKGEYLTVSDSTYQYDSRTTASDVTGVNLVWKKDLYPTHATLNKRALQLFAISGAQREPDQNGWYAGCRTYVYLPLASYKVDYSAGKVIKTAIHYNVNLGKAGQLNDCITSAPVNDITTAFRVSQYSPIYDQQKTLIVANASGASLANVVPVELKWKKLKYDEIGCDNYQLVKNYSKTGSKNFYFAAGGDNFDSIPKANSNTILAHWKINHAVDDNQLHTFAFEPVVGYGKNITDENKQLTGNYYFIKIPELTTGDVTTARAFNFANYATYPYTIAEDTLQITCVDHTLPFYNLEPGYELPAQLAILEAPFVDRNLTDVVPGFPHDKVNVNPDAYQVYLNRIGTDINAATYLTAWKTNVRRLGEGKNADETGHDIPYFAFSLNKDGKEYFLNIHKATKATDRDSVYWTYLTDAEQKVIFDDYAGGEPNKGSNRFWNYKFCLPYQVYTERDAPSPERIGELVDPAKYGDTEYQPVYIQTLDTAKNHYPDLVIAGSATRYATARNLYDAILPYANGVNSMNWNIYSVDYSQIDPYYVTSWIFGGKRPADHEWVPLRNSEGVNPYENTNPNANLDADGLLTNFRLQTGGHSFVGESGYDNDKPTEVNYGVLLSKTQLHFEYEGTERIGTYAKRPIYYYRIQIPGQDKKWLTDSYDIGGKYVYTWGPSATVTNKYNLAYFGNKITDNVTGKKYDKKYVQTFGFRYFDSVTGKESSDTIPAKTFVVVSNANFENAQPGAYRYLAEVNGHLVFVEGKDNALLFQFGRDKDGNYTGIEPIGTSGVIGVQGGVRLLNQTGTAAIYTVDGRLIKSVEVTGADQTIVAPRGVVIVKAAGKATKVVVK